MFDAFVKNLNLFQWLGLGGQPKAVRNPAGYTRTTGPYGEVVDADTLRCCHCGAHWEVIAGSGRLRGFCRQCMDYTCGSPLCMVCVPVEQRLENIEAGRPELTPTAPMVAVPGTLILPE